MSGRRNVEVHQQTLEDLPLGERTLTLFCATRFSRTLKIKQKRSPRWEGLSNREGNLSFFILSALRRSITGIGRLERLSRTI